MGVLVSCMKRSLNGQPDSFPRHSATCPRVPLSLKEQPYNPSYQYLLSPTELSPPSGGARAHRLYMNPCRGLGAADAEGRWIVRRIHPIGSFESLPSLTLRVQYFSAVQLCHALAL